VKRRWVKVFLVSMVLVSGLLLGGLIGILHSTTGARLLLSIVENQWGDSLEIGEVSGTISSGLAVDTIDFRDADLSITLDKIRLAIDPELFPLLVQIRFIEISSLQIRQRKPPSQITQSTDSAELRETLASLVLPFPVILSRLRLDSFEYYDDSGVLAFSAARISSAGQLHDVLDIGHLALESKQSRIELDGSLGLSAPFPVSLNARVSLALREETVENRDNIDAFFLESLVLNCQGRIDDYKLETKSILHVPGMGPTSLVLSGKGDETGLVISALHLVGRQLELAAEGEIQWHNTKAIRLDARLDRFDPSTWLPGWPGEYPLRGQFEILLDEDGLELSKMQFLVSNTPMRLDATATIDLDQGVLEADLAWSDIAWPIAAEEPEFLSQAGEVHLSGSPEDWILRGDTTIQTAGFAPGQLRLEANGNRESVVINIMDGQVLGGELDGNVEFGWTGGSNWTAMLDARGIDTGALLPGWPGFINTRLKADGSLEPFRLHLDIQQLDGEIRGRPLNASGQLHWQGEHQLDADIRLASGNSKLLLQGELFAAEGLVFSANIDDLGDFLPTGSGSVQANGRASLLPGKPRFRLDVKAEQLSWNGISVQALSIHDSASLSADTIAGLLLVARQIEVNSQSVDEIRLDLFADQTKQSASLAASYSGVEFSTRLSGTLNDWQHILEAGWADAVWNGQIEFMTLSDGDKLALQLEKPAPLQLSANGAALEDACIGTGEAHRLCLNTQWQRNGAYSANAVLHEFPLSLVEDFLDNDLTFTQQLSGEFSLTGAYNQPPSGQVRVEMSPGLISSRLESQWSLETGAGVVGFSLERGKLVIGALDFPLPGNGEIDIDIRLLDISAGGNTPIDGHAFISLNDLGVFSPFIPFFDRVAGKLNAQLDASGGALNPNLNGRISIVDGLVEHDASGLKLSDIQLAGRLLGGGKSQLSGSFKARAGTGELLADIDLSEVFSPRFELTLSGDNLVLFDSPGLKLVVEPDIQLGWSENSIAINGTILIPRARIKPRTIPVSKESESPDLVIVAGEIPGSITEKNSDNELAIRGDLEIVLGNKVELDLRLAVAKLDGSVIFSWQDKPMPMATGHYDIKGEINAFGQQLRITEGTISFPGILADNPHLDIRAERKIYGNSEIRRAGVFVNGTLKRMLVEPYTDPITTRERAQTLLITGSDFNMEQGVGAVDIGTYIAPRIFLSYGIGVFEDENVISLRYDLGRRWGIKATSGQLTTGVDINYVIEH